MTSSTAPLWRRSDTAANKSGPCHTVYSVKEAPPPSSSTSLRSLPSVPSSVLRSKRRFLPSDSYKGAWLNNRRHGYGVLRTASGALYEGHFQHNQRCGEGSLFTPSPHPPHALTRVYSGQWARGVKEGVGTYFYTDGSRYEGQWRGGLRHGLGSLFLPSGDSYTGQWDRGEQSGFGSLVKGPGPCEGDVYEGAYVRGKREGPGLYYYRAQGRVFDGDWANDQPVTGVMMEARGFFAGMKGAQGESATPSAPASRPTTRAGRAAFALSRPTSAAMLAVARGMGVGEAGEEEGRLPVLRLEDGDAVLLRELAQLALVRSPIRGLAQLPPLSSLYAAAVVARLRAVFEAALERRRAEALHPRLTAMLGWDDAVAAVQEGWAAVGRRGRVGEEEVGAALVELGKGEGGKAGRVQREEDGEGEVEDWRGVGFESFVYALHLLEQGRAVEQALVGEERRERLEARLGSARQEVGVPAKRAEEEKEQLGQGEDGTLVGQLVVEVEVAPLPESAPAVHFGDVSATALV